MSATIKVNMKQFRDKAPLPTVDDIKIYDSISNTQGKIITLDTSPYIDYLCEHNIFYTLSENA